jgi:microsomal dipeptidase-like Zn-dependent dipeptidase
MHLVPKDEPGTLELIGPDERRARRRDRFRARVVGLLSRFANYPGSEDDPRVTLPKLQAGNVRVVLSVLYSPFDEMDLGEPYGAPPRPEYTAAVIRELELVENDLTTNHAGTAAVARSPRELDRVLADGKVAFIHCVEGGFHLGVTPEAVERSVAELGKRGVGYITIAHLFWRRVATNAPAIPFIPDWLYRLVFHQPGEGLAELGEAAVRAMLRERILIDLTHMSQRGVRETLALLDEKLDPSREVPVFATHTGYRFGRHEYNLDEQAVQAIGARDGVIGLILANHHILNGLRLKPRSLENSVEVLCRHIDRIHELTGSHRHVGIGSDFDGFVKPTLPGLQTMADMAQLEAALSERYGAEDARLICSDNALRLLRSYWRSGGSP